MGDWQNLQTLLEGITSNVYFQPPENVKLQYPCIIFKRDNIDTEFANNKPYKFQTRYSLTVIDRDPVSSVTESVMQLPMCRHERVFIVNNLYHDVFTLYY